MDADALTEPSFAQLELVFDRCDGDERHVLADFLVAFADFDRRKLAIAHGYASSFAYLTERRGYSKSAAGRRIAAARLIARHPVVVAYLRDGRVGLTTLGILNEILSAPGTDVGDVLGRAAGLNEDAALRLRATLRPEAPASDLIRRLPAPGVVRPVTATLSVFRMTVAQGFLDDYRKLRDLLSHRLPAGRAEDVLHEAVRIAIDHCLRKRNGSGRPRVASTGGASKASRYVPVEVARAVWERDQGRCTYEAPGGKRCASTWQLQDDHAFAFARGGPATFENIRLLCAAHNRYRAEQDFGVAHVAARISERRSASAGRREVLDPPSGGRTMEH